MERHSVSPPDRRAAGLCRLRPGRPADRPGQPASALRDPARRDREGASRRVQRAAAGHGLRQADRPQRPHGRLPQRHPVHDDQRGRRRSSPSRRWASAARRGTTRTTTRSTGMFAPEFRNRLDAIIKFANLGPESMNQRGRQVRGRARGPARRPQGLHRALATARAAGWRRRATTACSAPGRWPASSRSISRSRWPKRCCSASSPTAAARCGSTSRARARPRSSSSPSCRPSPRPCRRPARNPCWLSEGTSRPLWVALRAAVLATAVFWVVLFIIDNVGWQAPWARPSRGLLRGLLPRRADGAASADRRVFHKGRCVMGVASGMDMLQRVMAMPVSMRLVRGSSGPCSCRWCSSWMWACACAIGGCTCECSWCSVRCSHTPIAIRSGGDTSCTVTGSLRAMHRSDAPKKGAVEK